MAWRPTWCSTRDSGAATPQCRAISLASCSACASSRLPQNLITATPSLGGLGAPPEPHPPSGGGAGGTPDAEEEVAVPEAQKRGAERGWVGGALAPLRGGWVAGVADRPLAALLAEVEGGKLKRRKKTLPPELRSNCEREGP